MEPLLFSELGDLPATVSLMTAARAFGLGRSKAYNLASHNEFPCRVLRVRNSYRIPTAGLLRELGFSSALTSYKGEACAHNIHVFVVDAGTPTASTTNTA